MTDPYLIAHKVRGEAAFDVAEQMPCPECGVDGPEPTCSECDGLGYWWIIPTSGHRAYPYWSKALTDIHGEVIEGWAQMTLNTAPLNEIPDHFQTRTEPTVAKKSLLAELGLDRPTVKINRRI